MEFGDGAALELDYYAGFAGEAGALSYDIGYLAFTYPGEDSLDFEEIYLGLGYSYFGLTYSSGQDSAPDNTEFSVALGDTGLGCLLYTSPSPRDRTRSRMPSSA